MAPRRRGGAAGGAGQGGGGGGGVGGPFRLQAGELVVNGGAVGDGGVLLLQVGDIVGRILVELGHGIGGVEHAVGLGLHAVERGDGALGAVGARGEAGDLLLRLGDGDLGLDGLAAALEVLDVAHELVVHLAHLLGVGVCSVIGLHELGTRSRKLLLLAQERAGIALVASGQGLFGEPLHAGDLGLVVVDQAAAALLLGNDAGGLGERLREDFLFRKRIVVVCSFDLLGEDAHGFAVHHLRGE